ncbi:hypothetical protein [Streptomyces cyaneus]|uniref:hypothetical protein n=1 Tax=Streptomyces cyaneus TaxID=1904 RepID=UPI000FF8B5A9|nr:hypothetical protein [Streptomyces cyaneus]
MSPPRTDLTDQVAREVQDLTQPLNRATGIDGTAATLERIVTAIDSGLGFRFLLRIVEAYEIPVTETLYTRYRALGERFGYDGSQITDAVEELVEHD